MPSVGLREISARITAAHDDQFLRRLEDVLQNCDGANELDQAVHRVDSRVHDVTKLTLWAARPFHNCVCLRL